MTEEEFIKHYFNKKIINEGDAIDAAVELGSQLIGSTDPFTKMLIQGAKYAAAKAVTDVIKNKKGATKSFFSKKESKPKQIKSKTELKSRDQKLKLRGMILNNGNLYLKYFLITFVLFYFSDKNKVKMNKTTINDIYTSIENNKYKCPLTGEAFKQSVIITSNAKINGQKINEDLFYDLLAEIFITSPNLAKSLYEIIDAVLDTTTLINQTNINSIFNQFYSKEDVEYKIG